MFAQPSQKLLFGGLSQHAAAIDATWRFAARQGRGRLEGQFLAAPGHHEGRHGEEARPF